MRHGVSEGKPLGADCSAVSRGGDTPHRGGPLGQKAGDGAGHGLGPRRSPEPPEARLRSRRGSCRCHPYRQQGAGSWAIMSSVAFPTGLPSRRVLHDTAQPDDEGGRQTSPPKPPTSTCNPVRHGKAVGDQGCRQRRARRERRGRVAPSGPPAKRPTATVTSDSCDTMTQSPKPGGKSP